jgi:predicted N-acetyltransferase YhbS
MQIRLATEADIPAITDLLGDSELFQDEDKGMVDVTTKLREGAAHCFLAIEDGKIVGHASIKYFNKHGTFVPYAPMAYLSALVVDPAYQRRGFGDALTIARLEHLESTGFEGTIASDAVTNHTGAQKILYKHSFHPVSVRFDRKHPHIGFYKLVGLDHPTAEIYVPGDLRETVQGILSPVCEIGFAETGRGTIDETCQELYVDKEQFDNSTRGWRLDMTAEASSPTIDFLRHHPSRPHYCAGFKPFVEGSQLGVYAHMAKIPSQQFDRDLIKVIPEAEELFDFVWDQCYDS